MTTDELRALLRDIDKNLFTAKFPQDFNLRERIRAALSSNFAVVPLDALNKAYLLGFNVSGEGYNGEFPFADRGKNPEKDIDWVKERDQQIEAMLAAAEGK